MRVRGRRQCRDCDHVWSYYDTGSISCPDCGSLRSVGVGDRHQHTDAAAELDLSSHRSAVEEELARTGADVTTQRTLSEDAVSELKSDLRTYLRRRGFVHGGDLRDVDDTYLAARELLHAVDVYARLRDPDDETWLYVLSLLRGADAGERPAADEVPAVMTAARGLAYAESLAAFRRDASTWLDEHPDPEARRTLGTLGDHVKRVEALEGDVPLETSESLVNAARELAAYAREDDETALSTARDRLARLS
jgi:hypothetical protein